MVVFPHAKINLGLNVLRLRKDGYRDIETVMVPIPLFDMLEVIPASGSGTDDHFLSHSGRSVPGDPAQDLCLRAVHRLSREVPVPALRLHLHKVIPTGAGLGGGSSDCAFTLMLVNRMLGSPLDKGRLHALAAELGSDVPFFLENGPQLVTGRGELLRPLPVELSAYWLLLVAPGIHVSTAAAYAGTTPTGAPMPLLEVLSSSPPKDWSPRVHNTMEQSVFTAHPELRSLVDRLVAHGADHAAMSGSGSSVFGIFKERPTPLALGPGHKQWVLPLDQRKRA